MLFLNRLCRVFIDCSTSFCHPGLSYNFVLVNSYFSGAYSLIVSHSLAIQLSYVEFMSLSLAMLFQSVFSSDLIIMLICSSFIGLHVFFRFSCFWLIVVPTHAKIGIGSDMSVSMIPDLRFSSLWCLI